ncbi:hypothetical protein [Mitsuaria sp. 7]|uniref:hypothetical protein n=1 Tax=Mitsuaria sp. 7 TaxID=1658665 RepID=UPI0007DD6DCC|nr:hypothetical protein [Mitsuaria sp. 7]ANH67547.1 hypothetical protein ABE85_08155 [Mitsuaria sp. 7]
MDPAAPAALDDRQQGFVDRLRSRMRSLAPQPVRDFCTVNKPRIFRHKAYDFSKVDALHRRWVRLGRPAHGDAAERFESQANGFRFDNDRVPQTPKLAQDRARVREMSAELSSVRYQQHARGVVPPPRTGLLAQLAACFPWFRRWSDKRRKEEAVRNHYCPPRAKHRT